MKGIIFRTFLDFAEQQLGLAFIDQMIEDTHPESAGAYTNIGTYNHEEMLAFVAYISTHKNLDATSLVRSFGSHLFAALHEKHSAMVDCYPDSFSCIEHLDETIHRNVRKIHPQSKTPNMRVECSADRRQLKLYYQSVRPFYELAYGLLDGCISHFGEDIDIECHKTSDQQGYFVLSKHD
jgi:hypothetical protein